MTKDYPQEVRTGTSEEYPSGTACKADPWKHRSDGMKCKTCMWFVIKEGQNLRTPDHSIGRCRRHAPSMNGYPVVFANDWCGDHKVDENKM